MRTDKKLVDVSRNTQHSLCVGTIRKGFFKGNGYWIMKLPWIEMVMDDFFPV